MKIQSRSSNPVFWITVLVLGITCVVLVVAQRLVQSDGSHTSYHLSQWNEFVPEIEKALRTQNTIQPAKDLHIYGGVVSHHIPTTIPRLVEYYSRLKRTQTVKNFIVIGPDHTDAGKAPITVSNESFFTAFGEVEPMEGVAQRLQDAHLANIEEPPFDPEHSIGSQMLLISRVFPGAHVTPIILLSNASKDQARALGKAIASLLDKETVLIASIDFSHYLSTDQAVPIDRISGDVVRNLDAGALSMIKADSDASLAAFIEAMNGKQALDTDGFSVLNTNNLMQNSDYTTGYVFGFWGKTASKSQ